MRHNDIIDVVLAVQIAINLNQRCLPNATDSSLHHDAASTIGGLFLNTVLVMLLSCLSPYSATSINVPLTDLHLIRKQDIVPLG